MQRRVASCVLRLAASPRGLVVPYKALETPKPTAASKPFLTVGLHYAEPSPYGRASCSDISRAVEVARGDFDALRGGMRGLAMQAQAMHGQAYRLAHAMRESRSPAHVGQHGVQTVKLSGSNARYTPSCLMLPSDFGRVHAAA